MRIDSHQHFWFYTPAEYDWIGPSMAELKRDFLPADLDPLLCQAGIDGCVAVQARQTMDETRWLLDLAGRHPFIQGVVGWVDLRSPAVEDDLARLAANRKLRGIRHIVQDEPDDDFLLRPDFRRGLSKLARFGLTYDLLLHPRHLRPAIRLVEEFPDQPFVLDHLAKPFIKDGVLEPWATDLRELARHPNVACKVSGLVTEAAWRQWTPADFHPYLDIVFEAFGEDRLLYGSDWPVCLLSASYGEQLGIVSGWSERLSTSGREELFGANAARIYRL